MEIKNTTLNGVVSEVGLIFKYAIEQNKIESLNRLSQLQEMEQILATMFQSNERDNHMVALLFIALCKLITTTNLDTDLLKTVNAIFDSSIFKQLSE